MRAGGWPSGQVLGGRTLRPLGAGQWGLGLTFSKHPPTPRSLPSSGPQAPARAPASHSAPPLDLSCADSVPAQLLCCPPPEATRPLCPNGSPKREPWAVPEALGQGEGSLCKPPNLIPPGPGLAPSGPTGGRHVARLHEEETGGWPTAKVRLRDPMHFRGLEWGAKGLLLCSPRPLFQ